MYVLGICYYSIIAIINRPDSTGKAGLSAKCLIIKGLRLSKCLTAFLTKRGDHYRPDPTPVTASGRIPTSVKHRSFWASWMLAPLCVFCHAF